MLATLPHPNDGETLPHPNDGETLPHPNDGETLPHPNDGETLPHPNKARLRISLSGQTIGKFGQQDPELVHD